MGWEVIEMLMVKIGFTLLFGLLIVAALGVVTVSNAKAQAILNRLWIGIWLLLACYVLYIVWSL
jgi:hypothetical protein